MVELRKKHHTKVFQEDGYTVVRLYYTDVVKFNDSEIILNTGGFVTTTTLQRMNQTSDDYGLGFRVHRKKGQTFVTYLGSDKLFDREVRLKR